MSTSQETEQIVLSYFKSWHEPADFAAMRVLLADNAHFDAGFFSIHGADKFVEMLEATESPWKDVELLGSIFTADKASLMYKGTDKNTGISYRVGEYIELAQGKITKVESAISVLPNINE